jgi:hypothetical protein
MATVAESFLEHLSCLILNKYPSISIEIEPGTNNLWICDSNARKIRFDGKINVQRISQGSYTDKPDGIIVNPPTAPRNI